MNVFVYGSLMLDEVVRLVLSRSLPSQPATLFGHRRFGLKEETYPGTIEKEGSFVEGVLLSSLSHSEIEFLDRFEGEEYKRVQVKVTIKKDEKEEVEEAFVYLYQDLFALQGEWSLENFQKHHLQSFLESERALLFTP